LKTLTDLEDKVLKQFKLKINKIPNFSWLKRRLDLEHTSSLAVNHFLYLQKNVKNEKQDFQPDLILCKVIGICFENLIISSDGEVQKLKRIVLLAENCISNEAISCKVYLLHFLKIWKYSRSRLMWSLWVSVKLITLTEW